MKVDYSNSSPRVIIMHGKLSATTSPRGGASLITGAERGGHFLPSWRNASLLYLRGIGSARVSSWLFASPFSTFECNNNTDLINTVRRKAMNTFILLLNN